MSERTIQNDDISFLLEHWLNVSRVANLSTRKQNFAKVEFYLEGLRERPSNFLDFFRNYGSRPRLSTEINQDVLDSIAKGDYKPKRHAGIIKTISSTLPKPVIDNIHAALKDQPLKALAAQGIKLNQYLNSRHLPCEEDELINRHEQAALHVEKKYNIPSDITEEEKRDFRKRFEKQILRQLQQKTYMWKAINYNDHRSKVYLIGRSSAEYAVLSRIFNEVKLRLPDFQPKSLFDFGSGVGTVTWAANHFWENSLQEYFCVDASASMNELANLVLNGKQTAENPGKGYFYRQFLPASHTLKYDLVVSAFSLFELPNLKSRLETILNLWKKTQGYLIVVEQGTNAGFQIINEVRDFILEFYNNEENALQPAAHVFAPCPHDKPCPRFAEDYTPCNFEVPYTNPFYPSTGILREKFSYVVLKKGFRPEDDLQWPRLVRPVLPRARHVVCRMCTSAGRLEEIIFTAAKHGKVTYKCARASHWGDLLPIEVKQPSESENDNENETKCFDEKDKT
ncbi:Uncharacterized protein GBIM_14183 [Gryllus bimaculatus]|nr:Uncharacterized protein GBIM_14183 [Gryllus bimaculatus]